MMSKERPILFSGPMVRAILECRKTQTRRVVKPQPEKSPVRTYQWKWTPKPKHSVSWNGPVRVDCPHCSIWTKHCPYGTVGDRLWVRETHMISFGEIAYAATDQHLVGCDKWRPSIHMPRWASRLTLEITGVRVERLQEISDSDAMAEGVPCEPVFDTDRGIDGQVFARKEFQSLWQSINGPESWAANPWVWVIEFKRIDGTTTTAGTTGATSP